MSVPVAERYPDELVAAVTAEVLLALGPLEPVVAAPSARRVDEGSSRRLAAIDRDLRTRLVVACNATMKRTLEKAGAKIISKSRVASAAPIRSRIKDVEAWRVPSVIGPLTIQAALGLTASDLLDTAFPDLRQQWDDWVASAQDAALRVAAKLGAAPLATVYAQAGSRMTADRQAGWDQLQNSLDQRAGELMDSLDEDSAPLNGDTLVPPQFVRAAMAVAGGYLSAGVARNIIDARPEDPADPFAGIGTGDTIVSVLTDLGAEIAQYQWLHGMSDRPLEGHLELDGTEFTAWDADALLNSADFPPDDYYFPGDHAGCFIGATEVSGPAPVSTFSRYYEGPLVEIATRAGKQLSVTPNHPILTDRGWIAAGLLDEGDRLVCGSGVEWMATGVPDDQQRPARIDDVINAFPVNRSVSTKAVVVAAEDFHGDGRYSKVGIIRADRLLAHEVDTKISEPVPQFDFGWAIGQAARLLSLSVSNLPFELELTSAHCVAATTGAFPSPLGSPALEVQQVGLARSTALDPGTEQSPPDDVAVYAVAVSESLLRLAGQISLDDVLVVRVSEFNGPVYNLGTRVGWYLANGIVAHNCTCDTVVLWVPAGGGEGEPGVTEGESDAGGPGVDIAAAGALVAGFNPDQPRDDDGRFASTGGSEEEGAGRRVESLPGSIDPHDPNREVAFKDRLGRCYELSAEYAVRNPGSTLVHGTIQGAGQDPIYHAWVETKDGRVFEPATGHLMGITEFHDAFSPRADVSYSSAQVSHEMLDSGHYGPWAAEATAGGPTGDFERDAARVEGLAGSYIDAGRDTQGVYDLIDGKEGKYTDDREQLHQQIIDKFVNAAGVESDRQLLTMAGLPGAGKTTFLTSAEGQQTVGVDLSKYVSVNADDIKAELFARGAVPSYPGLTPEESTGLVHEESSYLAKQVLATAVANGQNIAYDVTLSRSAQFTQAVELAQRAGHDYQTTAVLVNTPIATAVDRAVSRYENGGRFVPTSFITSMAHPDDPAITKPVTAFNEIKSQVDKWVVVDNQSGMPVVTIGNNDKQTVAASAELDSETTLVVG